MREQKSLYKSRPSEPIIDDFLINQNAHTLRNAPMDRYSYKIQHEIAFQKVGEANYAILSQLSIIFEIPDDNERVHESWKNDSDYYKIRG